MSKASDSAKRVMDELLSEEIYLYKEFSGAFVGLGSRGNPDQIACYDYEKCLGILGEENGWSREECEEWMSFNYLNAWVGDGTPFFLRLTS